MFFRKETPMTALTHPVVLSVFAGICFAAWPQFMNMSGLGGFLSAFAFATGVVVVVIPFAAQSFMSQVTPFTGVIWVMVVLGTVAGGAGVVSFNSMLAKVQLKDLGMYFGLMTAVQLTVAALVPCVIKYMENGQVDGIKLAGFVAVALGGYLLTR